MAQKWEFNSIYLRNKKKRISFRLTGRRSASRPTTEASLARVPACRAPRHPSPAPFPCSPLAHAPTAAEHARRVAAMRRRRRRASQPAFVCSYAPAYTCRPRCAPLHSIPPALSLSRARFSSRAQQARHRAPPHPPGKFATPPPPRLAIERQQLCLALRHLVLAIVPSFEPR